jgi:signal transduction histidine kinase
MASANKTDSTVDTNAQALENKDQSRPRTGVSKKVAVIKNIIVLLAAAVSLVALYVLSGHNYLLFHGLVEIFGIVIAFAIFVIAWNSRYIIDNHYLQFVGISFLFVAGFSLLHTLAYKGMGVFPEVGANLATQLWIVTRYLLSFSLFMPLLFISRRFKAGIIFAVYFLIAIFLAVSIFYWNNFPVAYIDDAGLTLFKVASEYIITAVFLMTAGLLVLKRQEFSSSVFRLLVGALASAAAAELAFTLYVDVYGIANMVGHLLNVVSFYLIYRALIETGFAKPYELLFFYLKQSEVTLTNRADELMRVNQKLEHEIVERKQVEEMLQQAQAKLQDYAQNLEQLVEERTKQLKDKERMAAIGEIAGMVGHDLRNPLQAVSCEIYLTKNQLSMLPSSGQKTKLQASIEAIEEQTGYMGKIVSDLQTFVKPVQAQKQAVNLKQLFVGVLDQVVIPENIQSNLQIKGALTITADPYLLKRVLINLVTNAVQAMPEGGELTIKAQDNAAGQTLIVVKDTGVGIPKEVKSKIFTPLFTTKAKGQGFGLAACKRSVESQGGTITFESEADKGTKFIITLPSNTNIEPN